MRTALRRLRLALVAVGAAALASCGPTADDTVVAGRGGIDEGPYDDVSVAAREAADSGKPVELAKLRSTQTRTFIRPDGRTLVERTDAAGQVTREVQNTPPILSFDQRQDPQKCNGGDGIKATSLTPTLSVTVTEVDHRVQRSKVRVYFEIYSSADSSSGAPSATGWSAWTEPYSRASWTVPPGVLEADRGGRWRARADDGETTSDWAAWEWHHFGIDLAADSEASCGLDDVGLGYPVSSFATLALDELVKAQPGRYQGTGAEISLNAVRRPGLSDEQVVAAALADGRRAILASKDAGVTEELKRRAAGALRIQVVGFTAAEVEAAYEDLVARVGRKDPTLPTVADVQWVSDLEHGWHEHVDVVTRLITDAQERALRERYGDRIVLMRVPADAPWTEFESRQAMDEINARRKKHDPSLPAIEIVFIPAWDTEAYVKVRDLSDPRSQALQAQYGERIRVDDGSRPPHFNSPPDDAW